MPRLKEFSPDGRPHLTEDEILELAQRYGVSKKCVECVARDVMRYDNDPSFERDEDLPSFLGDYERLNRHHERANVLFALMARKCCLSVYGAVEFLVAHRSR